MEKVNLHERQRKMGDDDLLRTFQNEFQLSTLFQVSNFGFKISQFSPCSLPHLLGQYTWSTTYRNIYNIIDV